MLGVTGVANPEQHLHAVSCRHVQCAVELTAERAHLRIGRQQLAEWLRLQTRARRRQLRPNVRASSLEQLREVYANLQQQIGYETIKGDASIGWLRLGALALAMAALTALFINRRLPN